LTDWQKRAVEWIEDDTAFLSVPFTWLLSEAWSTCSRLKAQGYRVRAGGPAVTLAQINRAEKGDKANLPDFSLVAELGGEIDALPHHNLEAEFTSRG